jgi:hypothetical protein
MQNTTPLFPGFHLPTLRRKPRSERQILAQKMAAIKHKSLSQLGDCLGKFIPIHYLLPSQTGSLSRRRLFSKENTFWAFLSQVLDADGGCQEVVRKAQAVAALKCLPIPSSSTAAYCRARQKLDQSELETILDHTILPFEQTVPSTRMSNRRVVVVDGTGLSTPDTPDNQEVWPQQKHQTPGCGFPQVRICGCFCLRTGVVLSYKIGNKKSSELPLLREQWETFKEGDIFLGDKGFCSYFDVFSFKDRGVDSVITLARRIPANESDAVKVLGENDLLMKWIKPKWHKQACYSKVEWNNLPEELVLRQIKVLVNQPGFRTKSFYIITTLLDAEEYTASEIADLYYQRWDVELYIRDIKTTMGMDILRCKNPGMVRKEILMHFIAYNCIRRLIVESMKRKGMTERRVSFKGSVQAIRQWEPHLIQINSNRDQQIGFLAALYDSIANCIVPERLGRREPRCVKRRPKPYQLLTKPRNEMIETQHRGKYHAKAA